MKKLATVLMLSFFALTASAAFADDHKSCAEKSVEKSADKSAKKSCAGMKCCAGDKASEKKAAKPADKSETAKPAADAKGGASSN